MADKSKNNFPDIGNEAQNVNNDPEAPGNLRNNDKDVEHAINKATEGMRQDDAKEQKTSHRDINQTNNDQPD